jgi:hypothetical protein
VGGGKATGVREEDESEGRKKSSVLARQLFKNSSALTTENCWDLAIW